MDQIQTAFAKIRNQATKDSVFAELLVISKESLGLNYQQKKLEEFSSDDSTMAGFRVIDGGHQGYAFTEDIGDEAMLRAYRAALENARMKSSVKSEAHEIPTVQPGLKYASLPVVADTQEITLEEKMKLALDLELAALESEPKVDCVPYSGLSETKIRARLMNTNGLDLKQEESIASAYSYPRAKEGEQLKTAGYGLTARSTAEIDARAIAVKAAQRARAKLGSTVPETGKYPVVIMNEVMSEFLSLLEGAFSAKEVDQNKSILRGKLGDKIASSIVDLSDEPLFAGAIRKHPFDSEGSPTTGHTLISGGTLKTYLTNS